MTTDYFEPRSSLRAAFFFFSTRASSSIESLSADAPSSLKTLARAVASGTWSGSSPRPIRLSTRLAPTMKVKTKR